jgi:hypothetical protein
MSQSLYIVQGATFIQPFRWGVDPIVYKPVTGVIGLAPLRLNVVGHGIPEGWRVECVSFKGLTPINSSGKDQPTDYHYVTVLGVDSVELNDINATDMPEYVSGGILKFFTPRVLTGFTAELKIWDKANGTERLTMDLGSGLDIDTDNFIITVTMSAAETLALEWKKGVFALKMTETATGIVTEIAQGPVTVELE